MGNVRQEQLKAQLWANAENLSLTEHREAQLRQERAEMIRQAKATGIGASELARLLGVSRQAISNMDPH